MLFGYVCTGSQNNVALTESVCGAACCWSASASETCALLLALVSGMCGRSRPYTANAADVGSSISRNTCSRTAELQVSRQVRLPCT